MLAETSDGIAEEENVVERKDGFSLKKTSIFIILNIYMNKVIYHQTL